MNMDHCQLDVVYISSLVSPVVRAEHSIPISVIKAVAQQITGTYSCTYKKVWLANQRVITDLFGHWVTPYMDVVCREKPRTVIEWCLDDGPSINTNQFQRVLWSFGPSIEGFRSCHPVISIDDTHLYGQVSGGHVGGCWG